MKRSWIKIMIVSASLSQSAWALPWVQNHTSVTPPQKQFDEETINFSGTWIGECNQLPAVNMTIKQDKDKLSLSYGFTTENYFIGEIKANSSTKANSTLHGNTFVNLVQEDKALVFINSDLFRSPADQVNVFFSKVVMVLDNNILSVQGKYFHTSARADDFQQQLISCTYRRGS